VASPPTGTVTFLFTDLEGSTRRWERYPEAMSEALSRHHEILRAAIQANNGRVVKTAGDGVHAVFSTATDALEAALEAQRALLSEEWAETGPLRVRMALHTGATEERDGDYYGPPVNLAARLLSAGHGGQVLLSSPTQELVRDTLPVGACLEDLGERRLKDVSRPERIFQLTAPGLPSEFPPIRTLEGHPDNLPLQSTPLVGREREIQEVCRRLRGEEMRLLTLTGPGGTGKTRLALQAAADLLEQFDGGVFFVSLAAVTDPELVPSTIAGSLGLKESAERSLEESLEAHLYEKELLLVLDNFEQVLEGAPFVGELLGGCPRLKVLATSRTPLMLYGEQDYPVPPLELPDPVQLPPLERLTQYEAVRLFLERARAIEPGFSLMEENARAVAEICVRLDGLPLAIELAAARIKLLPSEAMLQKLSSRLKLLTGGARDLPERQRTLRSTMEWSHALLEEGERTLFARLGVFSGGRTLEAIESVCDPEGDLPVDALDGVSSLLDKSLLKRQEGPEGEPRFVMLATIHEYASEKLQQSGEAQKFKKLHAAYFLGLAEEAEPEIVGPDQVSWMGRLEAEQDNFRTALSSSLETGDVETVLRIGGALWWFWSSRGHFSEGRGWLNAGLTGGEGTPVCVRAKALLVLGDLSLGQSDYARAVENLEASLGLYREIGDKRGEAHSLFTLGWMSSERDEFERAAGLLEESLALSRAAGTSIDVSRALNGLAVLNLNRGDYVRASVLWDECLSLAREAGDIRSISVNENNLALAAAMTGEYERAETLLREAHEINLKIGDTDGIASNDNLFAVLALSRNDPERAEELSVEAIRILQERAQKSRVDDSLDILAAAAALRGEIRRAARIWGATAEFREATGVIPGRDERELIGPHKAAARARLDWAAWNEEWERGSSMTLDQTVDYALEGVAERTKG
jgi:predicted ATPase/class 3 adenylate cyclase